MPLPTRPYIFGSHYFFFRESDTVASIIATASRARTTDVATIVTPTAHGLWTGAVVTIAGVGGVGYNQVGVTITVVNSTTFTYSNSGGNEATTPDTGGTVTLSGVASSSLKPGPNDPSWIEIGVIESSSTSHNRNDIPIFAPSPGTIVKHDVLSNKHELFHKFVCQEFGAFQLEMLYQTLGLDSSSTQFNPLEGPDKKGWLKIERYDQNNELREVSDWWGRLMVDGDVEFGGADIVKPSFQFDVLHSSLNTGTL